MSTEPDDTLDLFYGCTSLATIDLDITEFGITDFSAVHTAIAENTLPKCNALRTFCEPVGKVIDPTRKMARL